MSNNEVCANCGRMIGKLETPYVWREKVVCEPCHKVLASGQSSPMIPSSDSATPAHNPDSGSGLATAAIVMGIIGLLVCPCALLALIFGGVAAHVAGSKKIKRRAISAIGWGLFDIVVPITCVLAILGLLGGWGWWELALAIPYAIGIILLWRLMKFVLNK